MQVKYRTMLASGKTMCECSVADAHQIIAKLLHCVRCLAWLYCLWEMCDEDCLMRLDNYYSLLSLWNSQIVLAVRTSKELGKRTFIPYTLFSSAFIVMYFSLAIRKPPLWIFLTSDLSEYEAMTSFISAGETWPDRQCSNSAPALLPHATPPSYTLGFVWMRRICGRMK